LFPFSSSPAKIIWNVERSPVAIPSISASTKILAESPSSTVTSLIVLVTPLATAPVLILIELISSQSIVK
jgi:hypothetical protein